MTQMCEHVWHRVWLASKNYAVELVCIKCWRLKSSKEDKHVQPEDIQRKHIRHDDEDSQQ